MPQQRRLTLTEEPRHELIPHRARDPCPYVRERSAALLKIATGNAPYRVAPDGWLKPRQPDTVYQGLNQYEAEGLPEKPPETR